MIDQNLDGDILRISPTDPLYSLVAVLQWLNVRIYDRSLSVYLVQPPLQAYISPKLIELLCLRRPIQGINGQVLCRWNLPLLSWSQPSLRIKKVQLVMVQVVDRSPWLNANPPHRKENPGTLPLT